MKTALLQEKITLFRKTQNSRNSFGQVMIEWQKMTELFASVRFLSGKETIKSTVLAENNISVRVRTDSISRTITADDRIEWQGKTMAILAVNPDLVSRKYIDLVCQYGILNKQNPNG